MGLTFTTEDAPDLTLPEDSIHRAQLQEIKLKEINWTDRKTGEPKSSQLLEWWWEITSSTSGDEYVGRKVKGETDAKLTNHPRNKFRMFAEALLGRDIPVGMAVDTDDLTGLTAEIVIGHRQDRKDPAKVWEFVSDVAPVSGFDDAPPF